MSIPKEIKVIIKGEDKKLSHDFLVYDDMTLSYDDVALQNCITETKKEFNGTIESIKIKISMEVV